MSDKKIMEEIAGVCDAMQVQLALNTVQLQVVTDMLLGVYSETLPAANAKNIIENYFETLKKSQVEALDGLPDLLFDFRYAFREKMNVQLHLDQMKSIYLARVPDNEGTDKS